MASQTISTSDFKNGMTLDLDGQLFGVVEFQHVKPGKGGAFVRTKLRNTRTGAVVERTFRAGESVGRAIIDKREMQYLYREADGFVLMDTESYEQLTVAEATLGDAAGFITDGSMPQVQFYGDEIVGVEMPASVELKVTECEPGIQGDRVSGATKPATLETGIVVSVPLFINEGETIKVDTRSGDYISRA